MSNNLPRSLSQPIPMASIASSTVSSPAPKMSADASTSMVSSESSAPTPASPDITRHAFRCDPRDAVHNESANATSKILIVDSNIINRKILVAFMKKWNVAYVAAENGLEAVELYHSIEERFDVVLMAMTMPVMDGMAATRAIRQYEAENNAPRSYIIALTRNATESAKTEAWESGIDEYMVTPVSFKVLGKCLEEAEERRTQERMMMGAGEREDG